MKKEWGIYLKLLNSLVILVMQTTSSNMPILLYSSIFMLAWETYIRNNSKCHI